ncbi:hypothetical protein [Alicyclobacillus acidiphilus]|uniref:hypothetical protein n=1 Tax=Alicyclobacillus acidiphilus TaxID=182455 RepID=UPI0008339528|nr:hypothetical protein [Alicyclobacillus acidiphilus]
MKSKLAFAAIACACVVGMTGCGNAVKQTGNAVGNAAQQAGNVVGGAAQQTGNVVGNAAGFVGGVGGAMVRGARDAGNAVGNAVGNATNSVTGGHVTGNPGAVARGTGYWTGSREIQINTARKVINIRYLAPTANQGYTDGRGVTAPANRGAFTDGRASSAPLAPNAYTDGRGVTAPGAATSPGTGTQVLKMTVPKGWTVQLSGLPNKQIAFRSLGAVPNHAASNGSAAVRALTTTGPRFTARVPGNYQVVLTNGRGAIQQTLETITVSATAKQPTIRTT